MGVYDEYILQSFPDKDGKPETARPKQCRLCWIQNNYPPFPELEKICNSTLKTIQKYSSIYNWNSIRQKATELKAQQDQEELQQKQKETLTNLDEKNDKRLQILDEQIEEITNQLTKPETTEQDKEKLRKELREIIKDYHLVQNDKLRTVNLPDKINDKQDHKHSGELELSVRLKKYLGPDNIKNAGKDG